MLRLKRPTLLPGSCQKSLESCTIARYSQKVKQSSGGGEVLAARAPRQARVQVLGRASRDRPAAGRRNLLDIFFNFMYLSCKTKKMHMDI